MSDVGLAKICKQLKVPLPGVGYWQKVRSGMKVKRPPLPPLADSERSEYRLVRRELAAANLEQESEAQVRIASESLEENRIEVSAALADPPPLVAQAERSLRNARPNEYGILRPRAKKVLDIRVGPDSLDRSLRIMDALIRALDARGFPVSIESDGHRTTTRVDVLGETLEFGLEELVDRTERPLTPAEQREKERSPWTHRGPHYDYSLSGRLALKIRTDVSVGLRRSWSDGKRQRVEDRLNAFVAGLVKLAVQKEAERVERERWRREREEEERRRAERARLRHAEQARLEALEKEVAAWHKSQQIRAYVEAVRAAALDGHGEIPTGGELDEWIHWAIRQADRFDPLVESPPSILDEKEGYGSYW